jgi:hypothetical protein
MTRDEKNLSNQHRDQTTQRKLVILKISQMRVFSILRGKLVYRIDASQILGTKKPGERVRAERHMHADTCHRESCAGSLSRNVL